MKGDIEDAVMVVVIFIALVLFYGDPDLYDAIIQALQCDH